MLRRSHGTVEQAMVLPERQRHVSSQDHSQPRHTVSTTAIRKSSSIDTYAH